MTKSKSHRKPILHITYPTGVKDITQDLPKDELVRRLKMLARSFQDMEQEEDNSKYEPLAVHITENYFLKHSSKDVRLLVACCVADVFRIFAPEAPYRTAPQLKTIFKFLCEQLWDLETTTSPLWKRYFYLLENLAMVKSFNICMELEDSNEIFIRLFTIFFSIVNKNHPPKVKGFMLDVMCPLISENDSVSPDLLEVILKYLVESKKVENPNANLLAKELIKRTATSIEPAMQTYFNNALVLGKSSDSELSSHTYELIYQLNLISNNLLLAVLPQLEFKLKTSEEKERLAVTKLLGRMFSEKESDLASNNKPLWNCFLGRFSDISCVIRIQCVKFVPDMISHHPYLVEDLADRLRERVHDVEDDVRIEAVQALVSAAKKDISVISPEMLELVKERTLDKKWRIRKESILGLAHIYKKWCHSEEASEKDKKRLLWIKDKILHSYYLPELDDKLLVERIFTMNLVPYTLQVPERMQRLLELFVTVDDHSVKAIMELTKCQHIVRTHLRDLLEALKKQTDGEQNKTVFSKIMAISKCLPDSNKSQEHLKKMVKALQEDGRLLSYMNVVISPDVTCKKAAHAVGEVMKKFSQSKSGTSLVYNTVKTLMERVAPLIQDMESTREFLKIVVGYIEGNGEEIKGVTNKEIVQKALKLLQMLAHVYPYTFKSEESFNCLTAMVQNEDVSSLSDTALQMLTQVGESFEDHFPEAVKELSPLLTNFAISGSRQQAKHSIRCINCIYTSSKKEILEKIFKTSQKSLSLEHEHYVTALTAVAYIAHLAPEQFLGPMKTIIAGTIVKGVLMQDKTEGSKAKGIWCLDDQLSEETQGKLLAIKVLVHWLLGLRRNISGSVISTIRLLTTMLKNDGDLMERKKIGRADMSRLRLAAGCALLKLAQEQAFTEFISLEQFQLIALLINDECFQVREKFAEKLSQGLIQLKLPLSYMSIFSLSVKDPVKDSRKKALGYIKQCIAVRRQYLKQQNLTGLFMIAVLPEYVIPHTIHLLSHDPDFVTPKDFEALNDIKECLWFILEPLVSKPESASFVKKMLETIKQMKDAQASEDKQTANKKLYAVCEVGLGLITTKLPGMVKKEHPGDIILPGRLFIKPKKPVNPRDSYLPKKLQQEFSQVAEAKAGEEEVKEEKGTEKKKQGKAAVGKKKSGDENESPLGKKENNNGKTEDKKTAKSRKVLKQKEENDLNRSKRSLRGKSGSTPKRNSSPSKKALSSTPDVQSPNPKTKQTNLNKFVTSNRRSSGSSSPASQKSPNKSQSDASSSSSSPAKRRREAATSKSSKNETNEKDAKKAKGIKGLLNVKDKGERKMIKTNKVATIKRTGKTVSRTGAATGQKRRASSPLKASPEKRSKGTPSKASPQKKTAKVDRSPTKTSPVKSSQKKKTPVSASVNRRNQKSQKADQAKKRTPTPSPKKSAKKKPSLSSPSPPLRSTRGRRKQSPSPSPTPTKSTKGKQNRTPKPSPSPKSSPVKKPTVSPVKTSPSKKATSTSGKKPAATRKTGRQVTPRSKSPLSGKKSSPLQTRGRQPGKSATKVSRKTPDKTPPSPSKSPKPVTRNSQRGRRPTPAGSKTVAGKSQVSPAKTPKSPKKPTRSATSPIKSTESPVRNTRRGRPKSTPSSTSGSTTSSRKTSPVKGRSPSPQKSASSSPAKSPKSPPRVRRVKGKLSAVPKPSPSKKAMPTTKKPKSPTTKQAAAKTRSSGKTPLRDTVKRKLVDSESSAASSPARSSRSSISSAKSSPRKSPSPVKSRSTSPVKTPSPKKTVRPTSNLRNTNKGGKPSAISQAGKNSATKRKAPSRSPSVSPKKQKTNSSPTKSTLNISRRSHRRKR
ncbi:sister chromatid cohesion protein PDS5 homolog A-B-like [Apostichopus japonicus]|uniref:sister chromatid cohesion protein PDS5 homolog A-B-like n=1 Tax=Stichopus japonicus TaxID=307972 RepID=UPI003AB85A35